jgi:hypothetical protein
MSKEFHTTEIQLQFLDKNNTFLIFCFMSGGKIARKQIQIILLLSFSIALLLMSPDLIFASINETFKIPFNWKVILFLMSLSIGLALSPGWFAELILLF